MRGIRATKSSVCSAARRASPAGRLRADSRFCEGGGCGLPLATPRVTYHRAAPADKGRAHLLCRADLGLFSALLGTCAVGGIAVSLSRKREGSTQGSAGTGGPQKRRAAVVEEEEEAGFFWAIAAVLSVIPLANWTVWLLLAQADSDEDRSPTLCYAFAVLYALPALQGGLLPDATDFLMLGLGALHVQVERLARTQPNSLPTIPLPPSLAASAEVTAERLLSQGATLKEQVEDATALPGVDPLAKPGLKDFDKRIKKREEEESVEDSWR